jgi:hypothetical protein
MAIKRPISEEIVVKLWQVEVLMGQGVLSYIRADNGSELIAEAVRDWIKAVGAKTAHISSQCRHRRTATAKASMEGCETNCSMARSFTRYVKPRSSLKDGGTITTPKRPHSTLGKRHQRQRPSYRWTNSQSCTNFQYRTLK